MSTYGTRRRHGSNYLYFFIQKDKFQRIIIIPSMCNNLLQEGDQLNCGILIWFWEINVFQI